MISRYELQNLSRKHQTTELNIRREYLQHLFLSYFYQQKEMTHIYFKGGTALRIIFGSPRFSEDLDFSASVRTTKPIEKAILNTLKEIGRQGIKAEMIESKKTSGGYLADLLFTTDSESLHVLVQISSRQKDDTGEIVTVAGDFLPAYTIMMLDRDKLTKEKIQALLTRTKPRDFYDLYFLIRSSLLGKEEKKLLVQAGKKLKSATSNFEKELKQFLPKSHWPIIRNFPESLMREIERFL